MIRLNGERDETVYISSENIAYMKLTTQGQTGIKIADGYVIVTDSMEEVARKVLEYRLAMARFPFASLYDTRDGLNQNVDEIYELAGLKITG